MEPAEGIFLAEGEKVILRALDAGFVPVSALMEAKWLPGLESALAAHDCTVYLADEAVLKSVTGTDFIVARSPRLSESRCQRLRRFLMARGSLLFWRIWLITRTWA